MNLNLQNCETLGFEESEMVLTQIPWGVQNAFCEVPIRLATNVDRLIDHYARKGALQATGTPFGAVLWPSSLGFMRYWEEQKLTTPQSIVELGCGVGVLAGYFSAKGCQSYLATDGEAGLAKFVEHNSKIMVDCLAPHKSNTVGFQPLLWNQTIPSELLGSAQFLVACDVLYENEHIKDLPRAARDLMATNGIFYLCDPKRFRYEAALHELSVYFELIETTVVPLNPSDHAKSSGVVSAHSQLTHVNILKFKPRP
jgi:predicted nicotinamide N-methyase